MNQHLGDPSDLVPLGSDSVPNDLVPGSSASGREEPEEPGTSPGRGGSQEPSRRNQVGARGTPGLRAAADQGQAPNVRGKSGDANRGAWCTCEKLAKAVGPWDLDPFSNPRSHIIATAECMLERGDDGFGRARESRVGEGWYYRAANGYSKTYADTKVWGQPDYSFVLRALRHYMHTRWCFLLRFDPRPEWFDLVYDASELVCVLRDPDVRNFEPPPGVTPSGSTFPHALYYRHAEDVTDEVLALCLSWRKKPKT